ncbi:MAG: histidine kinase N-terminal 7TM domain-containing protein [Promethearchaeota archaeon]
MPYEFTTFAVVMGALTVLAFCMFLYPLIFRPKSRLVLHFMALIGSTVIWSLGYTLDILAVDKATKLFWIKIEYLGIVALCPFFLLFILIFTNRVETASKPIMGLLFFPPFIHWLLLITNEYHEQFYKSVTLNTETPFNTLDLVYGPVFYSHTIYSYLLLAIGFFLLLQRYFKVNTKGSNLYQKQILILIIGSIFPILGNIIRIFKIPPLTFIDLTPVAFVICYILFFYALFEVGFLDLVPFAHQFIIKNLADIGIIATTRDNLIVDINESACQYIFESECPPDIIGSNLFAILSEQERLKPYHEGISQIENSLPEIRDEPLNFEMELLYPLEPQGQFYRVSIKALREKNNLLGFIYLVQNITLEKEIELLLRKSIDFKNSLLSVISHDLKNQLMVIQGFTDVLRKELSHIQNFAEIEESLDGINAKTRSMQEIITDVRSYLKTLGTFEEVKDLSEIDVKEIIKDVMVGFKSAIKTKNLELNVNWPADPKIFTLADLRLRSVFSNIIDNAIKWSPPNEVIEISVEKEDQFWRFSISDHGPGVPDGLKDEIFRPFVSIGPQGKVGSGLGLSISLEILQSYKSKIWIENVKPQGAKFVFRLPVIEKI